MEMIFPSYYRRGEREKIIFLSLLKATGIADLSIPE